MENSLIRWRMRIFIWEIIYPIWHLFRMWIKGESISIKISWSYAESGPSDSHTWENNGRNSVDSMCLGSIKDCDVRVVRSNATLRAQFQSIDGTHGVAWSYTLSGIMNLERGIFIEHQKYLIRNLVSSKRSAHSWIIIQVYTERSWIFLRVPKRVILLWW